MIANSFARIHWQNLANFGVLALEFTDDGDYDRIEQGDVLVLDHLLDALRANEPELTVRNDSKDETCRLRHRLSPHEQIEAVVAGGLIPQLARNGDSSTTQRNGSRVSLSSGSA